MIDSSVLEMLIFLQVNHLTKKTELLNKPFSMPLIMGFLK